MTDVRWETAKLKYVADCNRHVLPESTPADWSFKYIDIGAVEQGSITMPAELTAFSDAPSRARRLAEPGDTIISTVRTYLRAVATVPETDEELVFSTGFAVLHPRPNVSRRFLAYVLQGDAFVDKVITDSVGVSYPAITATDLMALDLSLPPLDEQRAIAEHLDQETAQIDALVAKQEEFIRLLTERRRSAIEQRLSSIAARWTSVRHLARVVSGSGFPVGEQGQVGEELPFFKVKDLKNTTRGGVLNLAEDSVSRKTAAALGASIIPRGSLTFAKIGAALLLGRVGALPVDGCVDNNMTALVPKPDFEPNFARYLMLTFDFKRHVLPGPVPSLDMDGLRAFRVPMLSLKEQREIVAYLDEQTSRMDTLIAKTEEHIVLAKERRSALITAAVTGQLDVRTAGKAG